MTYSLHFNWCSKNSIAAIKKKKSKKRISCPSLYRHVYKTIHSLYEKNNCQPSLKTLAFSFYVGTVSLMSKVCIIISKSIFPCIAFVVSSKKRYPIILQINVLVYARTCLYPINRIIIFQFNKHRRLFQIVEKKKVSDPKLLASQTIGSVFYRTIKHSMQDVYLIGGTVLFVFSYFMVVL